MSRQQSDMPIEEGRTRTGGHKRGGRFEVWMRCLPHYEWHRIRRYQTRALADANAAAFTRKWNGMAGNVGINGWEFEVREAG